MIKDGNYQYGIYEEIKDHIYNAFIEYYGKENEKAVREKLDRMEVSSFDDKEYVLAYYDKFIQKYRNEILNEFYHKLGIARLSIYDNVIWKENQNLSEAPINIAMLDNSYIDEYGFTDSSQKEIKDAKDNIINLVGSKIKENDNDIKLKTIHNIFNKCVRKIEDLHPCDVFKDVQKIDKNNAKYIAEFLYSINEDYIDIGEDYSVINSPDFKSSDTVDLLSDGLYFFDDLEMAGLSDAFSSVANEILKDKKTPQLDKIRLISDRLRYLLYLNTKFKNFTDDQIDNIDEIIKTTPFTKAEELYKEIMNEYNYQCQNYNPNSPVKLTEEEKKKAWEQGQFIPTSISDSIRGSRHFYNSYCQKGLGFVENMGDKYDSFKIMDAQGFSGMNSLMYEDEDIYHPQSEINIMDKYSVSFPTYIHTLVHELNHGMSHNLPYEVGKDYVNFKQGVGISCYRKNGNKLTKILSSTNTLNMLEYINDRQAQEITEILVPMLEESGYHFPSDFVLEEDTFDNDTYYQYFAFLLEDFYQMFHEELKDINVNPNISLNFDMYMGRSKLGAKYSKYKAMLDRKFNKNKYFTSGEVDMKHISKLNGLVQVFSDNIAEDIQYKMSTYQFKDKDNWENLPVDVQIKLDSLVKEKEKVMNAIKKDSAKKILIEVKNSEKEKNFDASLEEFMEDLKDNPELIDYISQKIDKKVLKEFLEDCDFEDIDIDENKPLDSKTLNNFLNYLKEHEEEFENENDEDFFQKN